MIWNIDPEIIRFGPVALRYYSLFFAAGIYLSYIVFKNIWESDFAPKEHIDFLLVYMFAGTLIGARIGHCIIYEYGYYSRHILEIILPWQGSFGNGFKFTGYQGLASHGGAVGILAAVLLYCRKYKYDFLWLMDRLAVVIPLAGGFIRLGNFMNSEIIGIPTDRKFGVIFSRIDTLPRHPAQLYEAICYFILFGILLYCKKNSQSMKRKGEMFGILLFTLFSIRFVLEFVKANHEIFESYMILNMGQLLSVPFILVGVMLLTRSRFKTNKHNGTSRKEKAMP